MNYNVVLPPQVKAKTLIHIVEPDLQLCERLSLLLRLEGYETRFSQEGYHMLSASRERTPDVVVINLSLALEDDAALLGQMRKSCPGLIYVMIAHQPAIDLAVEAMKLGASDVFCMPFDDERFLGRIRTLVGQNIQVHSSADGRPRVTISGFKQLTPREREVLELLANGFSNKEAGSKLEISDRTVEVHRARVMTKLKARNAADLMRIVMTSYVA